MFLRKVIKTSIKISDVGMACSTDCRCTDVLKEAYYEAVSSISSAVSHITILPDKTKELKKNSAVIFFMYHK